jgi:cell division transport system permease protein
MSIWLAQHAAAFRLATARLIGTPGISFLAALAIGIALALPTGGHLLLGSLQKLAKGNTTTPQISVFMKLDADKKSLAEIESRLKKHDGVGSVNFVSRDAALKRMRQDADLAAVIDSLPRNPFPDAFVILPRDDRPGTMESMRDEFRKLPQVEHVQLDSALARRLSVWLKLGQNIVWILAGLFGVGLVALIFNTIRLQVLTRREEIEVSRLLGATDTYIGRPFYYFGALQSLLGGLFALGIVTAAAAALKMPVAELTALYSLDFNLYSLQLKDAAIILGIAAALGWLGAVLSVRSQLRNS